MPAESVNMSVNIAGVTFKNPVTVASGTFGSGMEYSEYVDLNRLGAVTTKGVANVPWPGNPTPRIAETYGGMINAIGLQNPGLDTFLTRDIPFLKKYDTGGFAVIHSVLERVHTRMSEVGEAADGMRSGVEIAIGAMGKALENSKFLQALQALWDGVKTIGNGITKAMKTLASGFVEDINNVNFSSVFDVLSGISLAGIAVGINKFLKGITDAVSDVTKLTDQIKGILDSVRGCFEAYQTQLRN